MLRRLFGLTQVGVCAIILSGLCADGALGQDRPMQLSALLIDEADVQLKRENCTGVGNARVMYAAAQVLFQEYDELKQGREALHVEVANAAKTAQEMSCEATITDLVPPEGSSIP